MVPARGHRRGRRHRPRVRDARARDGSGGAGEPIALAGARCRGLQARRRHPRRGGGHPPHAPPHVRRPRAGRRHADRDRDRVEGGPGGDPRPPHRRCHGRCRHRSPGRRPDAPHTARADAGGVGDVPRRRREQGRLPRRRRRRSADLRGLGGQRRVGHRDLRQGGRDVLAVSPQALRAGDRGRGDPSGPDHDRRHLGRRPRHRRAHLHEPRPPRGDRRHRPRRPHPWRDRGATAGNPRDRGASPVHTRLRGCPPPELRHDARHPRHAQDRRRLQHVRAGRPRSRDGSTTRSGSIPSSSTGTAS